MQNAQQLNTLNNPKQYSNTKCHLKIPMRNYALTLIGIICVGLVNSAYAETEIFQYSIDEHTFDLEYDFSGNVLAMQIDQELRSFLIGIQDTNEGQFVISIPNEMISAQNGDFVILVDGIDVEYGLESSEDINTFTIPVFNGAQEIEIIGTNVIPEFPLGVLVILVVTMTSILVLTKKNQLFRL